MCGTRAYLFVWSLFFSVIALADPTDLPGAISCYRATDYLFGYKSESHSEMREIVFDGTRVNSKGVWFYSNEGTGYFCALPKDALDKGSTQYHIHLGDKESCFRRIDGVSNLFPSCISKSDLQKYYIKEDHDITCEIDKVHSVEPMRVRYKDRLQKLDASVQQGQKLSNDHVSAITQTCGQVGDEDDKKHAQAIAAKNPSNEWPASGGAGR